MDTITIIFLLFVLFQVVRTFVIKPTPIETPPSIQKAGTLDDFTTLLASNDSVVIDFYADWCGPCRAIAPIFASLSEAHSTPGKLAFAKVNADDAKDIVAKYDVHGLPSFLIFRKGENTGVKVDGYGANSANRAAIVDDEGRVVRIRGADKKALEAVVKALVIEEGLPLEGAPKATKVKEDEKKKE
ncbi:Thioredoxin-like fold [Rhypophila decipiens]